MFPILALPTTLADRVHRQAKQLRITTQPRHIRCTLARQRANRFAGRVGAIKHHDNAGSAAQRPERPKHLPGHLQCKLVYGTKLPAIMLFQIVNVGFVSVPAIMMAGQ